MCKIDFEIKDILMYQKSIYCLEVDGNESSVYNAIEKRLKNDTNIEII